jgi:molybdenum cofactor synthesis domain-containing protein
MPKKTTSRPLPKKRAAKKRPAKRKAPAGKRAPKKPARKSSPAKKDSVTAAVLIIGNEVLSGRTQDANLKFLAEALNAVGVRMMEARVIADDEPAIVAAVNALRRRHDYVFTTGGIGPTHDDITAQCVAKAFRRPFGRNAEAEARLLSHYRPEDVTEARMSMADMPAGVTLIDNPVSRAPGFRIANVFVLPGVPRIMQAMFDGLKSTLAGGKPVISRTIVAHLPEGLVAGPLEELQKTHRETEIGSYPFFRLGKLGTSLVVRAVDQEKVNAAAEAIRAMIRGLGGEPQED